MISAFKMHAGFANTSAIVFDLGRTKCLFFPTFCSRSVPIGGLNITNARVLLRAWNNHNKLVNQACEDAKRCTVVKYEQLVLRPRETMTRLLGEFTCQRPPLLTLIAIYWKLLMYYGSYSITWTWSYVSVVIFHLNCYIFTEQYIQGVF